MEERERSFFKNGGILLEDMIASCNGKCYPIFHFSADEILRATNNFNPPHAIQKSKLLPQYDTIKSDELDLLIDDDAGYTMYMGFLDNCPIIVKEFKGTVMEDELLSFAIRDIVLSFDVLLLVFWTGKKPDNKGREQNSG